MDTTIVEFVDMIREMRGKPMDFGKVAQLFTLDVLSRIAFGKCFGFVAAREDIFGYGKAGEDFFPINELMSNHAFFRALIGNPVMQKLAAPKDTDEVGLGRIAKFARECVEEKFKSDKPSRDMIGHFVSKGLTQLQVEAESALQIVAGSDSTTTILRCTLYLLAGSPTVYNKLKSEVDEAVSNGAASHPVVTYAETESLQYLQACVWEGMRMVSLSRSCIDCTLSS
jgi:cytochrome P450